MRWTMKPSAANQARRNHLASRFPENPILWPKDIRPSAPGMKVEAWGIKEELGASAVIYTQIADVEAEINGLLTCDRAVVKPDIAVIKAANEGRFAALPPNPKPEIVPTSQDQPENR